MPLNFNKLNNLKYHPLCPDDPLSSVSAQNLGITHPNFLPDDYNEFRSQFPRTGMFGEFVVFKPEESTPFAVNGQDGLNCFFGNCSISTSDIVSVRDGFQQDLDPIYLIVGETISAGLVCLKTAPEQNGSIYVWDRDSNPEPGVGLYYVCESFSKFISLLAVGEDAEEADGPEVTAIELSEDLKAKMAEYLAKNKK